MPNATCARLAICLADCFSTSVTHHRIFRFILVVRLLQKIPRKFLWFKKTFHTALKWLLWTVDINCWNKLLAAKSIQAIMKAYPSKIRMNSSNLPWGKKKPHTHTKNPTRKPSNNPILRSNGFGTRFSTFLSFLISFKCCLLQTLYLWLHNPWIHAKHTLLFYSKQAIHIQNTSKKPT